MRKPALFDTTVWIDFFNGKTNTASELLYRYIKNNQQVYISPIIIQEVLQGIKDDNEYRIVKQSLLGFDILIENPTTAAIGAAELYRQLRKKGITIRKSNDCMIAYYALRFDLPLVHNDSDFDLIASATDLRVYR